MCIPLQFHAFTLTMYTDNTALFTYKIANIWLSHDKFHIYSEILSFIDVHVFWPQKCLNIEHL